MINWLVAQIIPFDRLQRAQLSKSGAKVLHLFELSKYFCKKSVFFVKKLHICQ